MLPSPGFSKFRQLMDTWDAFCAMEAQRNEIDDLLDKQQLIMFFKKGNDYFGAPEESRLIFAKLKSDDEDSPPDWKKEAKFIALNLAQALAGQQVENMFGEKDLGDLSLLDRDSIIDMLMSKKGKK